MKRFVFTAVVILLLATITPCLSAEFAVIGAEAPDFSLLSMSGEKVALRDYRGKAVVLNFWATWCPPCRAEMPSMEELSTLLVAEDFVMLAVNVERDGRNKVAAFLRDRPHSFPILLDEDGRVQRSYGVYRYPETFIIRRDGIIADKVIGAIDWSDAKIVEFLRFLSKG
ncbi:MAG: TlpA family protein disulfide reductase [Desulfuromonadaceae bacterium]|nr:TlpA family protein disulfide reductase [Desulfuromonadaceae bacterium]